MVPLPQPTLVGCGSLPGLQETIWKQPPGIPHLGHPWLAILAESQAGSSFVHIAYAPALLTLAPEDVLAATSHSTTTHRHLHHLLIDRAPSQRNLHGMVPSLQALECKLGIARRLLLLCSDHQQLRLTRELSRNQELTNLCPLAAERLRIKHPCCLELACTLIRFHGQAQNVESGAFFVIISDDLALLLSACSSSFGRDFHHLFGRFDRGKGGPSPC
mmetsp:Transcript_73160/g.164357  ORF Transcript_73160/g.164357 Transcript_73160/m.164357 type:complete len:217 (+) Transcript_73160:142-792(+)